MLTRLVGAKQLERVEPSQFLLTASARCLLPKDMSIEELRLTAAQGRFLGPFARILLVVASLREHDRVHARELLVGSIATSRRTPFSPARFDAWMPRDGD